MTGLEDRYSVKKRNDKTGKHDGCSYFVLDPQHDSSARFALRAYAVSAEHRGNTELADDIKKWLSEVE